MGTPVVSFILPYLVLPFSSNRGTKAAQWDWNTASIMADNLDDLLDEVEAKFCRNISVSSQRICSFKADQVKHRQQRNKDPGQSTSDLYEAEDITNHIEAVLQEILCDDDQATGSHVPVSSKRYKESCPQTTLKKCCPVYLGGSSIRIGVGTSITQRNNMPDYNKLRVKLKKRQGARAYACQCSWHSALTLSELRHLQQLKWVCGQHKV
ncbi:cilia- and flagella-associated protein 418 isoform X2 [Trichomycterus rosablanca]|uniref:cilia- and flagella-associated protein 418 isoform X2 n=1 Tax=Trichomycterus rosablanca TaxID=2290929 RepID=UPI002F35E695